MTMLRKACFGALHEQKHSESVDDTSFDDYAEDCSLWIRCGVRVSGLLAGALTTMRRLARFGLGFRINWLR